MYYHSDTIIMGRGLVCPCSEVVSEVQCPLKYNYIR